MEIVLRPEFLDQHITLTASHLVFHSTEPVGDVEFCGVKINAAAMSPHGRRVGALCYVEPRAATPDGYRGFARIAALSDDALSIVTLPSS